MKRKLSLNKARSLIFISLVVLILMLSACGQTPTATTQPVETTGPTVVATESAPTAILNLAKNAPPISFDPATSAQADLVWMNQIYASLMKYDKDGKPSPDLATSWKYIGTGNTKFQMTIREGVKFADGTPLTAQSVADSLNYFAQNGTGPSAAAMKPVTASVLDANTVELNSTVPNPAFPDYLSSYYLAGMIISPAGLADKDKLKSTPSGAGQYILDTANSLAGDHYVLVPNVNYYDQSAIKWKQINIKIVPQGTSVVQAMQQGQMDIGQGDPSTVDAAKAAGLTIVHRATQWLPLFILDVDGVSTPALKDVNVRLALNKALDRVQIAKAFYGDYGRPAYQPGTPGVDGYDPTLDANFAYDLPKAKQLLADAGFADGFTLSICYLTPQAMTSKIVQAVADQWSKVNVKVDLLGSPDYAGLGANMAANKCSSVINPWDTQEQWAYTNQVSLKDSMMNPFHYIVPGLQEAFNSYMAASQDELISKAQAVQKIIVDQALVVPIVQMDSITYVSKNVTGVAYFSRTPNFPTDWAPAP